MKRIFITGSEGFIGSHLLETLSKSGNSIDAMYLYNSLDDKGLIKYCRFPSKNNINFISGDVRDAGTIEKHAKNADVIIHLAALIGIPYSYNAVKSYIETNITGTFNILETAKKYNIKQTIIFSTSEVYGNAQYTPMDEKHPLSPQSPYSASKIASDSLALSYIRSYEMPITILRPFNNYGERQSLRAVIPAIITQMIHKNEINIGNTSTMRDFVYVKDTVNIVEKAILNKKTFGEIINIGTGRMCSIEEIIELLSAINGRKPKIISDSKRMRKSQSEVDRLMADNRKMTDLIGRYDFTRIDIGLKNTFKWYKDNIKNFYTNEYII